LEDDIVEMDETSVRGEFAEELKNTRDLEEIFGSALRMKLKAQSRVHVEDSVSSRKCFCNRRQVKSVQTDEPRIELVF